MKAYLSGNVTIPSLPSVSSPSSTVEEKEKLVRIFIKGIANDF